MNTTRTEKRASKLTAMPLFAIVSAAFLATGCVTAPPQQTPLAEAEVVEVELFVTPSFEPQVPEERDPQYHVGANAGGGAIAGLAAGAQCGPLLIICSPFGAIVGAAGGAIYGATAGAVTSLPPEDARSFNAVSAHYFHERDLGQGLKQAAEVAVVSHDKGVGSLDPDATLSLNLSRLDWTIGAGNTVRLSGTLSVRVEWNGNVMVRIYENAGERVPVDHLLEDDGTLMDGVVDALLEALVSEMVDDLDVEETDVSEDTSV